MNSTRRKAIQAQASLVSLLISSAGVSTFATPEEAASMTSFGFDPDLLSSMLVRIQLEKTSVCGFIADIQGKKYVLTSTQLISGHNRFTLSTLSGIALRPSRIELSTTRDIARIQIESDAGLNLGSGIADDDQVVLADFAAPGSFFSEIGAAVQNASEERFDLTTPIKVEHCGSPVLNADMQVCGLPSKIDYFKSKNREWYSATRLFIYRIEGTSWFSPNWKQYDKSFGKPLRAADNFREQIYRLAGGWMKNLKSKIETEENVSLDVDRWIKQHNGMVSNLSKKRNTKGSSDPKKAFRKDFSDSCNALGNICSAKAKNLQCISEQKGTTPFLKNQFLWRSRELLQFVKFVQAFEESNRHYNW